LRLKHILLGFLFLSSQMFFAQKEASHWYFGHNAGLDFSGGDPIFDTSGSLNTIEGCATISDSEGNLLFYTDGTSVWNRRHFIMPTGKGLFGDSSSTQSAIIVPNPENDQIYYIFTVDWSQGNQGMNYYTVDMQLDGGFGDVIGVRGLPKRELLLRPPTSEKITAVQVFNDITFWIISLKSGRFYVYKVDRNGVNSNPVKGNDGFNISKDKRGYLKVSPDGKKLVSANFSSGTFLYDFNDATGVVSNERQLDLEDWWAYGVEFSPLSKKLYISTGNVTPNKDPQRENLYQFNLDNEDLSTENLNNSRVKLHTYLNQRSALQLGPNGKIYRAIEDESFLGVINKPEEDGTDANYVHGDISLGGKISAQGLPPFIQTFFSANIQVQNQCLGDETSFTVRSNEPVVSIEWDFGDGSAKSTEINPTHMYNELGEFTVKVIVKTENEIKEIEQIITIFEKPSVISPVILKQCDDNNDGITLFNLRQSENLISQNSENLIFTYHLNRIDAEDNRNSIENPESFSNELSKQLYVRISNEKNCGSIAELNLQVSTTAIPEDFLIPLVACDNDLVDGDASNGITNFNLSLAINDILMLFPEDQYLNVTFYENMEDALTLNNVLDTENYRNESSPFFQDIVVRVDDNRDNGCVGLGYHVKLETKASPVFDLKEHQFLCLSEPQIPIQIKVEDPQGSYTYTWHNANGDLLTTNKTSILNVTEPGDYFVTAINSNNCENTKKIDIVASSIAVVEDIKIEDGIEDSSVTIEVSGEGDYEFSLDDINGPYQRDNFFSGISGGEHTIYVKDLNGCGIISEGLAILNIPKFFTPNNDGINDTWKIEGIFSQPNSKVYIFDKFGKVIKQINTEGDGWDGNYKGRPLPSTDYWYHVQMEDGRNFKGHFSLIRR